MKARYNVSDIDDQKVSKRSKLVITYVIDGGFENPLNDFELSTVGVILVQQLVTIQKIP